MTIQERANAVSIPRLQLAHITKRYPAVVANSDVSLTVQPGETHAVLGENGAGKSTLMKIIYGSVKPDEGSVLWNGQPVHIRNPQEARALGISMVFQHFSLFDTLTVAENVWLGLDKSLTLNQVTHSITAKAARVRAGHRPGAAGAHAVGGRDAAGRDHPRAAHQSQAADPGRADLGADAAGGGEAVRGAQEAGRPKAAASSTSATSCTRSASCAPPAPCCAAARSPACAIRSTKPTRRCRRMMIGAEPPALEHHDARSRARWCCRCRTCTCRAKTSSASTSTASRSKCAPAKWSASPASRATASRNCCMRCRARTRARSRTIDPGVRQGGRPLRARRTRRAPGRALRAGGAAGPRRRAHAGPGAQPHAHAHRCHRQERLDRRQGAAAAGRRTSSGASTSRPAGPHAAARSLSGGNLQKFIVGREIDANPKLLIVSQPTWGVDVGAAAQIRGEILALRDAGCAVLVVSEELEELFEISDRLHVIAKGRLSPSIDRAARHGVADRRMDERAVGGAAAARPSPHPDPPPGGGRERHNHA